MTDIILTGKALSLKESRYFHFHPEASAVQMANYLTENGFYAKALSKDEVELEYLDDYDNRQAILLERGDSWLPDFCDEGFTPDEFERSFRRVDDRKI